MSTRSPGTIHVRDQNDRMRLALELIASLPADAGNKQLALAVATAKAALADDHDPLCEVLR